MSTASESLAESAEKFGALMTRIGERLLPGAEHPITSAETVRMAVMDGVSELNKPIGIIRSGLATWLNNEPRAKGVETPAIKWIRNPV